MSGEEKLSELQMMNARSREVFRHIVETYIATGEPVGSRNLSRLLPMTLSPASVRNVMSDLEELGLIYAPHTSAGRMPTQSGLRLFVDGLLEIGNISAEERNQIEAKLQNKGLDHNNHAQEIDNLLGEVGETLSGLSSCAGLVLTEKHSSNLKQIEFVKLDENKALVILVNEDGGVENRIFGLPQGLPPSALTQAANYLNARIAGKNITEAMRDVERELNAHKAELDELTSKLVQEGLATWSGEMAGNKNLIIRGRSHLLDDQTALQDLERTRTLFDDMEAKKELINLLSLTEDADGIRIFIGAENQLFSLTGSSLIVSPFQDSERKIVGMLGVIGPTRLNYARIIPMVDYTAKVMGKILAT